MNLNRIIFTTVLTVLCFTINADAQEDYLLLDPETGAGYKTTLEDPPFFTWGTYTINYYIRDLPSGIADSEVDAAFQVWENAGPIDFQSGSGNVFIDTILATIPAFGYTEITGTVSGLMIRADIYLVTKRISGVEPNWTDDTYDWDSQAAPPHNEVDTRSIITHEIGHTLGIAHHSDVNADGANTPTMHWRQHPFNTNLNERTLETDDKNALLFLNPYFNATIDGELEFDEETYATWDAVTNGGFSPFTYSWDKYVNYTWYNNVGTSSSFSMTVNQEDMKIRVTVTDDDGNSDTEDERLIYAGKIASGANLPTTFALKQNYPNPFNASTEINYQLPKAQHVSLTIYNMLGQEVVRLVDKQQAIGFYTVTWDAAEFASGPYIYKLEAGDFVETKRMALIK